MKKKREILGKIKKGLFLFYPVLLILEPKIANNFIIFLLLILVLGNVYLNKKFVCTFYEKTMLFFMATLCISVIFKNTDVGNGFIMIKRHFRWLILPTLLGQLNIDKKDIKYLIFSIFLGIIGFLYRIIIEMLNLKGKDMSWSNFLTSTLNWNHRYLGDYGYAQSALVLGVTFLILLYLALMIKDKKNRIFLLIFSVISLILMLFTQVRGMFIVVFILIILLAILVKEKIFRRIVMATFLISLAIGIKFSNSNYINRYENIGRDTSSLARVEVYKEAFRIFNNNKLNGIGFEGFIKAQDKNNYKYLDMYYHPHNLTLKLLSETGIIGFMGYYLFIASIFLALWKEYKNNNRYSLIGIITLLTLFIYENTDIIFVTVSALPYVFFIIGISLNSVYKKN